MRSYIASAILTGAIVLGPVLAEHAAAPSKPPFTVDNGPVHDTVVDTMTQRTCTGIVVPIWWQHQPNVSVQATFFSKPDGTKWVRWYHEGYGPFDYQVTELGVSAQWIALGVPEKNGVRKRTHYDVWPVGGQGDSNLSGKTVDPYGTITLTCKFEAAW